MSFFRLAGIVPLVFLLAACGGGDSTPPTYSDASEGASGRAVKGVLQYADASVYERIAGEWVLSAITQTDVSGGFVFAGGLPEGPVTIVITAATDGSTRMICDATECGPAVGEGDVNNNFVFDFGESMPVPANFTMKAILPGGRPADLQIAVTPFTHLASTFVERLPGDVSDQAIELALSQVAGLFGLDPAFAYQTPVDITSAEEVAAAGRADLRQSLMSAGFSEQIDVADIQTVLDGYAMQFSELAGQLPVHGLYSVEALSLATQQIVALVSELPAEEFLAAFQLWLTQWNDSLTQVVVTGEVNEEDLARARTSLDYLDHYLTLAGIDAQGSFLPTQAPQVSWLANEELLFLAQVCLESVVSVIEVSVMASLVGPGFPLPAEFQANAPEGLTAIYTHATGVLTIVGERNGQTVDIAFDVDPMLTGLAAGHLEYAVREGSTVSNSKESGELSGTLSIDVHNSEEALALALALFSEDTEALGGALESFLQSLHARASIEGSGSIVKTDDEEYGFFGSILAWGEINIPAIAAGGEFLTVEITSGEGYSPNGDALYSLENTESALNISVGSRAELTANFGFEAFNMPAMEVFADGYLAGYQELVSVAVAELMSQQSLDLNSLLAVVSALDLSALDLQGEGSLNIPADDKQWTFVLDGNRFDASQPNSTENALSFYVTSLAGGYIYSGGSLVATVTFDWVRLGATIYYVDGVQKDYFFGNFLALLGLTESA
tara:strand:+ start:18271 stop:20451 length:2181 start_codon:yes stop_codon:yes gene_type:complete